MTVRLFGMFLVALLLGAVGQLSMKGPLCRKPGVCAWLVVLLRTAGRCGEPLSASRSQ